MTNPVRVVALAGSLKANSLNHKLVSYAAKLAGDKGAHVDLIRLNDYDMPLFSEDIEKGEGPNAAVRDLRSLVAQADVLLVATPEYNGSITGVLKNTIDWLSRPIKDSDVGPAFKGKVVGLMATSPGPIGGLRGLNHARDVFYNVGAIVMPEPVAVGRGFSAFDEQGDLADEALASRIDHLVERAIKIGGAA